MLGWVGKVWEYLRSVFRIRSELTNARERLAELERAVQELSAALDRRGPPRPDGVRLVNGIYWRLSAGALEAYCPACFGRGVTVPLEREDRWADGSLRRDGLVGYRCPNCRHYRDVALADEERARGILAQ